MRRIYQPIVMKKGTRETVEQGLYYASSFTAQRSLQILKESYAANPDYKDFIFMVLSHAFITDKSESDVQE